MKSGAAGSEEVHPSWQESEGAVNEDEAPPPPPPPASLSVHCWEMGTRDGPHSRQRVRGSWASWHSQGDPWEDAVVPRQRAPGGGPAAAHAALPGPAPLPVHLASARLQAPVSHSPPSGGSITLSAVGGSRATEPAARCPCLQQTLSFPGCCSLVDQATQMCWSSLCFLYFFILLRFKLMLLSSQTLAHPGAPEGRALPAAGEGRNRTPACAHPGFWRTGARRDGPHWQGPSHHLPVHSCRSPRSAFRHCDLHTCEDVAAASHRLGPRQGSPGTGRSESLGAPGRDQGWGEGPGCGGSRRSAGCGQRGRSYSLSQMLRPRGRGLSLVHFSAQRPASNKKAIERVSHRLKVAQPHKVTSSQKLHRGLLLLLEVGTSRGPPGFLPPPEEQRVLMWEPHPCPGLLSPRGPLREATEAQRQRAWWRHSDSDSTHSRGCGQQTSAPPPYSAWDPPHTTLSPGLHPPRALPAPAQLCCPCLDTPGISRPLSSSRLWAGKNRSSNI